MSISIVVTIIALLSALACYAFITQSIEKKRVQKQRALMTLKTKHRNLAHMLGGFPPNFLPNELTGLIYRALIDTCEQLRKIEPKEQRHIDDITLYTNQLGALSKNTGARPRIDNPQQLKEVRQHLQELLKLVVQQEAVRVINKVSMDSYIDQIKRLGLQMAVDANAYQAKQAQQAGKWRLAIHFYGLAKKALVTENTTHGYDKQIEQLTTIIAKLEEKALTQPATPEDSSPTGAEGMSKEWDQFGTKAEDGWKKKNIYD